MYLGDPTQYTEEEREKLLKKLLEVFLVEDELVYEIGWDIPTILLPYFETSFDFYSCTLGRAPLTSTLMSLFSVLASKGNQKELFLKSIECLAQLEIEPLETDDKRSAEVPARFFELKFVAIFELLFSTLKNVKTQFPSRFLADGTAALVTFIAEKTDDVSLRTLIFILRRLFLFGRDYQPADVDSINEHELDLQRKLLRRYLTDIVVLGLHRFSLKLTQRFFVELKKGCAFGAQHSSSQKAYEFDTITEQFDDIIYRLMQLAASLDINFDEELQKLLQNDDDMEKNKKDTAESDSVDLSKKGIFLLSTIYRFDNRTDLKTLTLSFSDLIKLSRKCLTLDNECSEVGISAGIVDSLSFWALWVTRAITAEEVQNSIDSATFKGYLNLLFYVATFAPVELRQINYMIIRRLLSLSVSQLKIDYLIDTIEHTPYLEIRDVSIRMLKNFIVPPKASTEQTPTKASATSSSITQATALPSTTQSINSTVDAVVSSVSKLSIKPTDEKSLVTSSQQKNLEKLILSQVFSIESLEDEEFRTLLSWVNFLVVVDNGISQRVVEHSKKLLKSTESDGSHGLQTRITLLEVALSSLTKKPL
jgi:hypothetical protein